MRIVGVGSDIEVKPASLLDQFEPGADGDTGLALIDE